MQTAEKVNCFLLLFAARKKYVRFLGGEIKSRAAKIADAVLWAAKRIYKLHYKPPPCKYTSGISPTMMLSHTSTGVCADSSRVPEGSTMRTCAETRRYSE